MTESDRWRQVYSLGADRDRVEQYRALGWAIPEIAALLDIDEGLVAEVWAVQDDTNTEDGPQ